MKKDKIYIIKKYVVAKNAQEAIRKDKTTPVDDCWIEESDGKAYLESIRKNNFKGF